ncbi:P-loop containing nucleoside triphosphate hydrolase protein [Pelagophyceae sp. CCMP2097]|nr:P-loop containing nucleoside triphosphate hydrolase protein [Pelagophyceae sp. CCMP2097]
MAPKRGLPSVDQVGGAMRARMKAMRGDRDGDGARGGGGGGRGGKGSGRGKGGKNRRRRTLDDWVLRWRADAFDGDAASARQALGLPPVATLPQVFRDVDSYFASFVPCVLEEARATVEAALRGRGTASKGDRPFTVAAAQADKRSEAGVVALDCWGLGDLRAGTLVQISYRGRRCDVLAKIQANRAFDHHIILVRGTALDACCADAVSDGWTAQEAGAILPLERIYKVLTDAQPRPHFLARLVSGRSKSHVRFGGDADDAAADDGAAAADDDGALSDEADDASALNASQRRALAKCLDAQTSVSLVHGPPGTGKTTFVTELLKALVSGQSRVLVCAPSNQAVMVVHDRFLAAADGADPETHLAALVGVREKMSDDGVDADVLRAATGPWRRADCFVWAAGESLAQRLRGCGKALDVDAQGVERVRQWLVAASRRFEAAAPRFWADACRGPVSRAIAALKEADFENLETAKQLLAEAAQAVVSTVGASSQEAAAFDLAQELVASARVVFCTLSTSAGQLVSVAAEGEPFHAVVVDEAAQCVEAEVLAAVACVDRACGRLVLVGDPQQLPATVISQFADRALYGRSMLARLMDSTGKSVLDTPPNLLSLQYRMAAPISKFPNQRFYAGRLVDGPRNEERDHRVASAACASLGVLFRGSNEVPRNFLFLDAGSGADRGGGGRSYSNCLEAKLVSSLVSRIASNASPKTTIRVLTFYAAQVAELLRRGAGTHAKVSSVDAAQGQEADIVVVSFVRANARGAAGFLQDCRRLNVALTRARHCLVAVGHAATLFHAGGDLKALVASARERSCLVAETDLDLITKPRTPTPYRAPAPEPRRPLQKSEAQTRRPQAVEDPPRAETVPPTRPSQGSTKAVSEPALPLATAGGPQRDYDECDDDDAPAGAVRVAIADDEDDVPVNEPSVSSSGGVKVSIDGDGDDDSDDPDGAPASARHATAASRRRAAFRQRGAAAFRHRSRRRRLLAANGPGHDGG